ncbi:MAG: HAD-IC family P-type ATPase, partial [bacterium]
LVPGDLVLFEAGDQIPADSQCLSTTSFEVNEAFLTGESLSLARVANELVYAGSYVASGSATIRVVAVGDATKIGEMTSRIKRYQHHATPIQKALAGLISALSYVLILAVVTLSIRNHFTDQDPVNLIKQIAALTGTIIPEGLILASTLLFAYGAIRLLQKRILIQHIHSSESLARVQILCLDKTGTLTDPTLSLIDTLPAPKTSKQLLIRSAQLYLSISDADGEMSRAIGRPRASSKLKEINTSFSSERGYGAIRYHDHFIVAGAPDLVLSKFSIDQKVWVKKVSHTLASHGKRVLVIARSEPSKALSSSSRLHCLGLISFDQPIKESAKAALDFFKQRSVAIKIISGDHPEAVRSIAHDLDLTPTNEPVVTGDLLDGLKRHEIVKLVREHSLFARISPQQKAMLVKASGKLGYVGMVGDGANDALAIKQADVGISMFAAADITRSVADMVLLKNEFNDVPKGVLLADSIITTLELIGSLFLNKVIVGLTILILALLTNESFPFSPRNITVLNYFIIGLPILIWTLYPQERRRSAFEPSYLRQIMPFVLANGIITAAVTIIGFLTARAFNIDLQMTLFLTTLIMGMGMLYVAPRALNISVSPDYGVHVAIAVLASVCLLSLILFVPEIRSFFGLNAISVNALVLGIGLALAGFTVQLITIRHYIVTGFGQWLSGNR